MERHRRNGRKRPADADYRSRLRPDALGAQITARTGFIPVSAVSRRYPQNGQRSDSRRTLCAKLVSYAQGFSLLRQASLRYGWQLDYGTIAQIWREGCIIRSAFLSKITEAYRQNPELENLLFDDFFRNKITESATAWRSVVANGMLSGIPLPCMSAALSYFDGLRTGDSAANLIQAQRDYFGAHTFERTDAPPGDSSSTTIGQAKAATPPRAAITFKNGMMKKADNQLLVISGASGT